MRYCPYCHLIADSYVSRCAQCAASISALDQLRTWRRLRRFVSRLRFRLVPIRP